MNKGRDHLRISTSLAYVAPARGRANLAIRGDAPVRRAIIKDGRAIGVEVRAPGGSFETVTARQVVLAGGAIHTPAILLRSGIGPRDALDRLGIAPAAVSEGVGRNLMDHPAIGPTLYPKPGIASWEDPVIQTTLYYTATGSADRNDMQIEPLSFMHMPGGRLLMGMAACVFKSYSFGRLEFDSTDIDARPRILMDYLSDERDFEKLLDGVARAWDLCHTRAIEEVAHGIRRPTEDEIADPNVLRDWMFRNSGTGAHPSCTARMGPDDDPLSVCDQYGFVRGVAGLRIADASLMPRVPRVNTNVPTIMIGERIGEWVRQDLA